MRRPPRLQRRRQTWHLRVTVPAPLREIVGKREIIRSLRTTDYVEATRRLPLYSAEVEATLAQARRRLRERPATTMDEHEAKQVVLRWFWQEQRREDALPPPEDVDEALAAADIDEGTLARPDDPGVTASVEQVADRIMAEGNLSLDRAGDDYRRLAEMVRRGMLEQARRRRARLRGDFGAEHDPVFRGVGPQAPEPETPQAPGVTLGALCDIYVADPGRANVSAKTVLDYRFAFRVMKEVVGADRDVRRVTRDDCRRVRDLLAKLPPNASKRWPGVPLAEAAERGVGAGLSPMAAKTANSTLQKVAALMRWAEREEYIDRNPAAGLRVSCALDEVLPPREGPRRKDTAA